MCLILFALRAHPDYTLILGANRDEFHARPTAPASRWADSAGVLGGRDLQAGGTWLACDVEGRWAAVTNYRDAQSGTPAELSRGHLVSDYVTATVPPVDYVGRVIRREGRFAGYNLLVGTCEGVLWTSNRRDGPPPYRQLRPGIYGVSNHLLDTPWPKVRRGKAELEKLVTAPGIPEAERILDLMMDRTLAADHDLPSTGVTAAFERALSAAFIQTPEYGTRSSTALLVHRDGSLLFAERRFDPHGTVTGESRFFGSSAHGWIER
jgi:uncharacterized protein with NRDE domain